MLFHRVFQGRIPVIDVADAEFIKQVNIKEFSKFVNRRDGLQEGHYLTDNLLIIKDGHWKHVRSSLTPTFTSGKLKQVTSTIYGILRLLVLNQLLILMLAIIKIAYTLGRNLKTVSL